MQEIKKKFEKLQEVLGNLNNKKISLQTEVRTLGEDMKELSKTLLELTDKPTLKESVDYYNAFGVELADRKVKLGSELDAYLSSGEGDNNGNGVFPSFK